MEIIQQSQSGDFRTEKCVFERDRQTESSKTVVVSLELNSLLYRETKESKWIIRPNPMKTIEQDPGFGCHG
jgi:hypothetical protein